MFCNLYDEFLGRCQYQCPGTGGSMVMQFQQDGQQVGCCFSCTSLGDADYLGSAEYSRDAPLLDGRGFTETTSADALQERIVEFEVFPPRRLTFHRFIFAGWTY